MSHEQPPQSNTKKAPERLSSEEAKEIARKYTNIKFDEGQQHYMIEHYDENGKWTGTDMIPTWKNIPQEKGEDMPIEEALKKAGAKIKNE